jgi:hypothetical protein
MPEVVSAAVASADMVVAPAAPTRTDQRRGEVLDALMEADAAATADSIAVFVPTRLVDQTRLARRLGLSDRRVRMLWPAGAAFNADLVGHLIDRSFDESERVVGDLVEAAVEEEPTVLERRGGAARFGRYLDLVASMWDRLGRLGPGCGQGHALSAALAVMDPEVAQRARGVLLAHRHEGQVLLLAVMQAFEVHFRPAVRPAVYLGPLYGARLGFERLTLTHPSLGSRQADLADTNASLFGFGYRAIYQGLACEAVNDGAAHDHAAMPHL